MYSTQRGILYLRMKQKIRESIEGFSAAALATSGPSGINVVPMSVVDVSGEEIHLYDFFLGKTVENIKLQSAVAFTFWKGFEGF